MQTESFIGDISIRSPFATTYGLTCWKGNEYTIEYISITIKPLIDITLQLSISQVLMEYQKHNLIGVQRTYQE